MTGLLGDSAEGKRGYLCWEKIKKKFGVCDTNPISIVPRGAI